MRSKIWKIETQFYRTSLSNNNQLENHSPSGLLTKSKNFSSKSISLGYVDVNWVKNFVYFRPHAQIMKCKCVLSTHSFDFNLHDFPLLLSAHVVLYYLYFYYASNDIFSFSLFSNLNKIWGLKWGRKWVKFHFLFLITPLIL